MSILAKAVQYYQKPFQQKATISNEEVTMISEKLVSYEKPTIESKHDVQFVAHIIDTESYRDLQESYGAYDFVSELEIRTVQVLSRPYNQGTYCRCAGMARRPLTV